MKILAIGSILLASVAPASAVQLSFVAVLEREPLRVESVNEAADPANLAIRLTGQLPDAAAHLRVTSLALEHSEEGVSPVSRNVLELARSEFSAFDLSPHADEVVVAVPAERISDAEQIEAGLYGAREQPLMSPQYLTLRPRSLLASVLPEASSWTARLLDILDRILDLQSSLRRGEDLNTLYSFRLGRDLQPASSLETVAARGTVQGVGLSPSGARLAWISANDALRELWVLAPGRLHPRLLSAHSARLIGPRFTAERSIVYVRGDTLFSLSIDEPSSPTQIELHDLVVRRIYEAEEISNGLRLLVGGAWRTEAAPRRFRPMRIDVNLQMPEIIVEQLPVHGYYAFLSRATRERALYFAGRYEGEDGVHMLSTATGTVTRVFDCEGATQLSQSRDGNRIAFAAGRCP